MNDKTTKDSRFALSFHQQYTAIDASPEQKAVVEYYSDLVHTLEYNHRSVLILPSACAADTLQPLIKLEILDTEAA